MYAGRLFLTVSFSFALGGCVTLEATPQIQLTSRDASVEVKSKVSAVSVVSYSPDGKNLVSAGSAALARVWDVASASESKKIALPPAAYVNEAIYSPDRKIIAIASRTELFSGDVTRLWEADSGRELRTVNGEFGGKLSFSSDGKYLLGNVMTIGFPNVFLTTKVADVRTGEVIAEFKGFREGVMSPVASQVLLASFGDLATELVLMDLNSGREIWHKTVGRVDSLAFSPDGRQILAGCQHRTGAFGEAITYIQLMDAATGSKIREIGRFSMSIGFSTDVDFRKYAHLSFSPDGVHFMSGNVKGEYKLWNAATGEMIRQLKRINETIFVMGTEVNSAKASFSPSSKVVAVASAASVRLFEVATGEEIAAMIAFDDGEWLVTTPSGYYNASEKGDEYLNVVVGGKPYSTAQLRESFFRPDLVKVALTGKGLNDYRKIADVKPPPAIEIVDTPSTVSTGQVTLSFRVKDQGGGIGDVRLYRNGTAVVLEKTRNLQVDAATGGQVLRFNLSLEPGANAIRAIAFNAENTMQSADAKIDIQANIAARQPALHAVVVGIKDFANPRLALTYPVADAELFAATLEERGKGLFSSIHVRRLLKPQETTSTAIVAALKQARQDVHPEDLFVLYVASHGTVDDGQYLLITSNVGSTSSARLKQDALTQDALKELISNIPASKKLVVLDTCNAGKMGDALQVAMLTRGMSDDTAMKIMSRAVGSTILSAATSVQEALEGYKGHGLFTYVIVDGLNGAADANKDGFVKTLELADYVDTQVPELAERVFKHKQFPIVSPTGQGFPLVKTRLAR